MPPEPEQHPIETRTQKIGTLLVNEGYVHASDIDTALEIQKQEACQAALPLGKLLVKKGLIRANQLQRLLAHTELRNHIGAYTVETGLLDPATLDTIIQHKSADIPLDEALLRQGVITRAHLRGFLERTLDDIRLGKLAVTLNLISESDLASAVRAKKLPRTIGEILCDLHLITPIDLNTVLSKYRKHLKLGRILIRQGAIDETVLATVLSAQKNRAEPIGKILLQEGLITETQLYEAISIQYNLPFKQYDRLIFSANQRDALTDIIGHDFARRFHVLPVSLDKNHLTVAISDPESIKVIRALRTKQIDLRIESTLITKKSFERLFRLIYMNPSPVPRLKPKQLTVDETQTAIADGAIVSIELLSHPDAQAEAVARLHSAYEKLAIARGLRAQPAELKLFSEFIRNHLQKICQIHHCDRVLFRIIAMKSGGAITAVPAGNPFHTVRESCHESLP
ncbi:MAG: hypothetical protein RBT11_16600 [Desulfobacterales bacterium]|jgi:type IV pilus assembly protein PilB|nr:hypothetical protein [Desulfobacterales bacterium]